jgi:hypothetical protein
MSLIQRESVPLIVGNSQPVWQRTIPSVLHQTEKPPLRAVERAVFGVAWPRGFKGRFRIGAASKTKEKT